MTGSLVPITNWEEFATQPPYTPYVPLQWIDAKDWGNIIENVHEQIMDEGLKKIGEYNSQDDEGMNESLCN